MPVVHYSIGLQPSIKALFAQTLVLASRGLGLRIIRPTKTDPTRSRQIAPRFSLQTEPRRDLTASGRISFRRPDNAQTETTTCKNKRLRKQGFDAWLKADAVMDYWHARLRLDDAILRVQNHGTSEAHNH